MRDGTFNAKPEPAIKVTEANRDKVLQEWKDIKEKLDKFKALEMEYRLCIVKGLFPAAKVGTNNLPLGSDWKLQAVIKENYTLEKIPKELAPPDPWVKVQEALEQFVQLRGDVGAHIADRLVKWEPVLSVSEYKSLPEDLRVVIDKILTVSEASPELKLVPPKKAG